MKKIVLLITTFLMVCFFSITCMAEESGKCGENATWSLDDNGTLTVSGKGDMDDYIPSSDDQNDWQPWKNYADQIKKVVIKKGITRVSWYGFWGCKNLKSVSLSSDIDHIGAGTFEECEKLEKITIPGNVSKLYEHAFLGCKNLSEVTLPKSLTKIYTQCFRKCSKLEEISIPSSIQFIGEAAFGSCTNLKRVIMHGDAPSKEAFVFEDTHESLIIYYPEGATGYDKWSDLTCKPYKPVTKISLNKTSLSVGVNSSVTLKATITPADTIDNKITWSSSNKKIASISSKGVVKGISVGKVTITARSANGKTAKCTVTVNPSTPKLSTAKSAAYNKVKITWEKSSGASGYYVYQKKGDTWKKIATIKDVSTTSYVHEGLTCGKKYTYTVKAYKVLNDKTYSSGYDKKGITGKPVPSTPKLKKVSKESSTSVKITWNKVSGASGYIVYRKTGSGEWKKIKTIKKGSTISYTDKKLTKGKKYTYTVKAYRIVNEKNIYGGYNKKGLSITLK